MGGIPRDAHRLIKIHVVNCLSKNQHSFHIFLSHFIGTFQIFQNENSQNTGKCKPYKLFLFII